MRKFYFYAFIALALACVYIQTADLGIKQVSSPLIAGLVALSAVIGLIAGRIKPWEGFVLITAWTLAATGDIFFEMSRLAATPEDAGKFFIIAVAVLLVAYLIFGVSFNIQGIKAGLPAWKLAGAAIVSIVMGVIAYASLQVPEGQGVLIFVYTAQAVILLCGGLLCLMSERYHFAAIGILLFFSDWLVGVHAFGNPDVVPSFVQDHVLILILVTYYIPMLSSIDYAFKLGNEKQ